MRRLFGLLLLAVALAACTRATGAADAVRFAIAADPQTLDPLFAHADAASVEGQLARLAFEPFVDVDDRGRLVPVLLARIPTVANGDLSRDGRTIVYHLRPNVRWQDGVPVDAHDVVFTLHAIVDPRNPVRSREGYDRIARAVAVDAHTVRSRCANRGRRRSRRSSAREPHRSSSSRHTCSNASRASTARRSARTRSATARFAS